MTIPDNNGYSEYDYCKYRLQEVKNDINIINTHSKWVLSLFAVMVLGLASYIFSDFGDLPALYQDTNEATQFIKIFAGVALVSYSGFILFFTPVLLLRGVMASYDEEENMATLSEEKQTKMLKAKVKESAKRLFIMQKRFKDLIVVFILSPLVIFGITGYFTFIA